MKKNALVHMEAPKETVWSWFRRWHILPRFFCLLLALIIWLAVYQATDRAEQTPGTEVSTEETA